MQTLPTSPAHARALPLFYWSSPCALPSCTCSSIFNSQLGFSYTRTHLHALSLIDLYFLIFTSATPPPNSFCSSLSYTLRSLSLLLAFSDWISKSWILPLPRLNSLKFQLHSHFRVPCHSFCCLLPFTIYIKLFHCAPSSSSSSFGDEDIHSNMGVCVNVCESCGPLMGNLYYFYWPAAKSIKWRASWPTSFYIN